MSIQNVYGARTKSIVKYIVLPGIIPEARRLFASGFGYIAFLMAQVYGIVRLLPPSHPYLLPENIGRFGIRHVIAEAANHLVLSRRNIDQIIIFAALLSGVVLMAFQIAMLVYSLAVQPVFAQALSIFDTPIPLGQGPTGNLQDISFIMMDNVFGVPDVFCNFFGNCTALQSDLPFPIHVALHGMFQFYSLGLLLIAVLIFLYFLVVIVVETAATGTPFGQRFQNVWVPVRIVVALGLLVPINYGLNSGQYITLYTAKYAAGFATNAWNRFNDTIRFGSSGLRVFLGQAGNPIGESNSMVAKPQTPDLSHAVQFMSLAHGCAYAYTKMDPTLPALNPQQRLSSTFHINQKIRPYLVKNPVPWMSDQRPVEEVTRAAMNYPQAMEFYDNNDIVIVFGHYDPANPDYDKYLGNVKPLCGSIRVRITDGSNPGSGMRGGGGGLGLPLGGPDFVQETYYEMIKTLWFDEEFLSTMSQRFMELTLPTRPPLHCFVGCINQELPSCDPADNPPCDAGFPEAYPSASAKQNTVNMTQMDVDGDITIAWELYRRNIVNGTYTLEMRDRGWGGAGIWFNTISKINGAFVGAVFNTPSIDNYPMVMEYVQNNKRENDSNVSLLTQFVPSLSDSAAAQIPGGEEGLTIASALAKYFEYWNKDGANQADSDKVFTQNIFEGTMNMIFGTSGLFAMRGENAAIHPMAQLTALGKGLVDSAIRNIAGGTTAAALGGPARLLSNYAGAALDAASSVMISAAFLGLTAGFILYYILPFLPFIYFFFAVGGWVKGIFEAMVGVPLWALAHLRLDGEGLPGDSASNGYFLILEIFLRPILTVFGLIAAVLIFGAQVRILNFIWDLVIDNLTGYETDVIGAFTGEKDAPRNIIDEFFFTIIYAIIVYLIATASFKLINAIPNNILRWGGSGISSFGDLSEDPTQGLTRYAAIGGMTIGQQATQKIAGVAKGAGDTLAGLGGRLGSTGGGRGGGG